jgi:hypothetical protein
MRRAPVLNLTPFKLWLYTEKPVMAGNPKAVLI